MRGRMRGALLVSLTAVALMSVNLQAPRPVRAQTPGIYIALGDSIAAGIGASLPRQRGNAAIVAGWLAKLTGETVPFENLAVSGETAESFLNGGQLERFRDTVDRANASGIPIAAVTLSLGGNELLAVKSTGLNDLQAGLDAFSTQFAEAVTAVRDEIGPDTPLVLMTVYDLTEGDPALQLSDAWWIEQFNSEILRIAVAQNARVANVADLFAGRIGTLTHHPFDVHPSNAGHLAIARATWDVLELDDEPPIVDVRSIVDAGRTTPTVRFSVRDNVGIELVTAVSDQVMLAGPYEVADGEYAILIDLSSARLDEVAIMIKIGDDAGNVTSNVVTVRAAAEEKGESQ